MSWPSMRMLPLLDLVEAQQQVDERRLAGARAPDEADALAGPDLEVQVVEHARLPSRAAVGERHVLEADLAARTSSSRASGRSVSACGTAIVSMPSCTTPMFSKMPRHFPAHPAGDVGDLPGERQRGRDRRRAHLALAPQRDADARPCRRAAAAFIAVSTAMKRVMSRMCAAMRVAVLVDRLAHVRVLVARAREQLHRQDVGVAVDHAAHDERAHLRAQPREVAHARHEVAQEEHVAANQRTSASRAASPPTPSAPARRGRRRDVPDGADARDHALAQRSCAVCITRLAMRPAKSFWKNGQLCRTTCQWLCQRIRLVTPGITALLRTIDCRRGAPAAARPARAPPSPAASAPARARRRAVVGCHQRDQLADEQRNHRVEQRHRRARARTSRRTAAASGGRSASRRPAARAVARRARRPPAAPRSRSARATRSS